MSVNVWQWRWFTLWKRIYLKQPPPTIVSIEKTLGRICKRLKSPGIVSKPEPVFVNVLGIDSAAYVAWRAGSTNRGLIQARKAGNRFLGSLKGLQIRALCCAPIIHLHTVSVSVPFIALKRIIILLLYLYRIIQKSRPKIVWCWQRGIEPFEDIWLWACPPPPPPAAVLLTLRARFSAHLN